MIIFLLKYNEQILILTLDLLYILRNQVNENPERKSGEYLENFLDIFNFELPYKKFEKAKKTNIKR